MGLRSLNKYYLLLTIGMAFVKSIRAWYLESRKSGSPGGKDITVEEYLDLGPMIADVIMEALPVAAEVEVLILPKDLDM